MLETFKAFTKFHFKGKTLCNRSIEFNHPLFYDPVASIFITVKRTGPCSFQYTRLLNNPYT